MLNQTIGKCLRISLLTLAIIASGSPATAQTQKGIFEEGAKSLFIGHSFFVPVAKKFDLLAKENGYSQHEAEMVFAGGAKGLPGALWSNPLKRKRIEDILAQGDIELLGMVSGGKRNAGYEDYKRWIDLALKHNPDTVIFIGSPWMPGGPRMDSKKFDELTSQAGEKGYTIVQELRRAYPDNHIHFVNYGRNGPELRNRFDAGTLDDISQLVSRRDGLFSDRGIGHAGKMLLDLSARTWLTFLYGADLSKTGYGPYNPKDAKEVTEAVILFNQAYKN